MRVTAEITSRQEYAHLLRDALPHVVHTGMENGPVYGIAARPPAKKAAYSRGEAPQPTCSRC